MATVVNNPSTSDNSSAGLIIGLILLLAIVFLLFYYGLPALRGATGGGATLQVPSQIDVNVNPGGAGQSAPAQ